MTYFKKGHKYKAVATIVNGIKFPSKLEAEYYQLLLHQEKLKIIEIIELQPKVYMTEARILMKPDFLVKHLDTGEIIYHETKGQELPTYKIKKRLWKHYGNGKLRIIKRKGRNFCISDEVISKLDT